MSSTKPITSARRAISARVLAVLAVGVIAVAAWDAQGAIAGALGRQAAREAAAMSIGPARDRKLDEAQQRLSYALATHEPDAALWGALAETRYLQATGAEVRTPSPTLIAAALAAAGASADLAPYDARAQARLALVLSVSAGRETDAAEALRRSYQLTRLSEALAPMRIEAAAHAFGWLDARTQADAWGEACAAQRAGLDLSAAFAEIGRDPASCAARIAPARRFRLFD